MGAPFCAPRRRRLKQSPSAVTREEHDERDLFLLPKHGREGEQHDKFLFEEGRGQAQPRIRRGRKKEQEKPRKPSPRGGGRRCTPREGGASRKRRRSASQESAAFPVSAPSKTSAENPPKETRVSVIERPRKRPCRAPRRKGEHRTAEGESGGTRRCRKESCKRNE